MAQRVPPPLSRAHLLQAVSVPCQGSEGKVRVRALRRLPFIKSGLN